MNLKEYEVNLTTIKELLQEIRDNGVFANSLGGRVSATVHRPYSEDHTKQIPDKAADFLRLAVIRKVDRLALKLLRIADELDVDVTNDLIEALPTPYQTTAMLMQKSLEEFMEGELK